MRSLVLTLALAAAACSKAPDYTAEPLKATPLTVRGYELNVDLPPALTKDAASSGDSMEVFKDAKDQFSGPTISISKSFLNPSSVDSAVTAASLDKLAVTRKEALDSGYLIVAQSEAKDYLRVIVFRPVSDSDSLQCEGSQATSGGVPNFEKTAAWFEKICRSMKPKAAYQPIAVSAEMKDVMSAMAGSHKTLAASIEKYSAPKVDTKDIGIYDLNNPAIVGSRRADDATCYSVRAEAGVTKRLYELCWKDGKIVAVENRGMI